MKTPDSTGFPQSSSIHRVGEDLALFHGVTIHYHWSYDPSKVIKRPRVYAKAKPKVLSKSTLSLLKSLGISIPESPISADPSTPRNVLFTL